MDHRRIEGSSCRQWAVKGTSLCLRPFYSSSSRERVFSETRIRSDELLFIRTEGHWGCRAKRLGDEGIKTHRVGEVLIL
jgi:hypothetical protein